VLVEAPEQALFCSGVQFFISSGVQAFCLDAATLRSELNGFDTGEEEQQLNN